MSKSSTPSSLRYAQGTEDSLVWQKLRVYGQRSARGSDVCRILKEKTGRKTKHVIVVLQVGRSDKNKVYAIRDTSFTRKICMIRKQIVQILIYFV